MMQTRREFLLTVAGVAVAVTAPSLVHATDKLAFSPSQATAITQVLGGGVK